MVQNENVKQLLNERYGSSIFKTTIRYPLITLVIIDNDIRDIIEVAQSMDSPWFQLSESADEHNFMEDLLAGGEMPIYVSGSEKRMEVLTKEKLANGIRMYAELPTGNDIFEFIDHNMRINSNYVGEDEVDAILQYTLFACKKYREE